jgi:hypothetical protein
LVKVNDVKEVGGDSPPETGQETVALFHDIVFRTNPHSFTSSFRFFTLTFLHFFPCGISKIQTANIKLRDDKVVYVNNSHATDIRFVYAAATLHIFLFRDFDLLSL